MSAPDTTSLTRAATEQRVQQQKPVQPADMQAIESALLTGDIARLTPPQRVDYYLKVCTSLGLNPYTMPFEFITLSGKLRFYATKSCTEQLRKINGVGLTIVSREEVAGCYVVTARATDSKGRTDESLGAVPIDKLTGEARSNAMMKAETKAKRRVTLSICGLGLLDESETDSIPGAVRVSAEAVAQAAARVDVGVKEEPTPGPKDNAADAQTAVDRQPPASASTTMTAANTAQSSDASATAKASDTGEVATIEQQSVILDHMKRLRWRKGYSLIWLNRGWEVEGAEVSDAVSKLTSMQAAQAVERLKVMG